MKTKNKKPQVSKRLVNMMVGYYGTIEAARDAYREAKAARPSGSEIAVSTSSFYGVGRLCYLSGMLDPIEYMFVLPS